MSDTDHSLLRRKLTERAVHASKNGISLPPKAADNEQRVIGFFDRALPGVK